MDELDEALLARLRENARTPTAELARALGLSRTTVQSRLERLERSGVITGYTVRLSDAHSKGMIQAYGWITVAPRGAAAVIAALRRMPAVRLLHAVSGPIDMVVMAYAPSVAQIDALIDSIGALESVERTTSSIVLSTKIDR
jgi:DNA-binding Lrp family transcriptional regulator